MSNELFTQLSQSLIDGDPDATYEFTQKAIQQGIEPLSVIKDGLVPGMNVVGDKFETGEYFLPDLIIAADGMQKAMELLEPELLSRNQSVVSAGTVLIGTVKGDIHEIGKSLVGTMLSANGFKVYDIGADVSTETFIEKVKELNPTILGLSALLTTTMTMQKEVISALTEAGIRNNVKVMVGGAPVTRSWASEIGADGYAEDAMGAVQIARQLSGN